MVHFTIVRHDFCFQSESTQKHNIQGRERMNSLLKSTLLLIFSICCACFRPHAFSKVYSTKIVTSIRAANKDAFDSSELEYGSSSSSKQPSISASSPKKNLADGIWKIDSDSAEIEVGSSSSAQMKSSDSSVSKPPSSSAPSSTQPNKPIALSSSEGTGFDLGLLIAFPVIVGTLGLFFVFPFIGESLSQGSQ